MESMPVGDDEGLAHTLIDEAGMMVEGAGHDHAKPAAGSCDHAPAITEARTAMSRARGAEILVGR